MNQLTIFDAVEDSKKMSSTKCEPTACISSYSPNGRKTKYYRLLYRVGKKVKAIHIRGGSVTAKLANYRASVLQGMIDRGAPLAEIISQTTDWR